MALAAILVLAWMGFASLAAGAALTLRRRRQQRKDYPFYYVRSAPQRFVVRAERLEAQPVSFVRRTFLDLARRVSRRDDRRKPGLVDTLRTCVRAALARSLHSQHTMGINGDSTMRVWLVAAILAVLVAAACGSKESPAQPTPTIVATAGVTLSSTVTAPGTTVQGAVSLTSAASSGGATIVLSSSNAAVATVPASVIVPAGASSSTFAVAAAGAGTAVITARLNGDAQSPVLTVTAAPVALSSLSLNAPTVVGGNPVTGRVTLSGPAPAGGAEVLLMGDDPISVARVLDIPAGSITGTFTFSTRAVPVSIIATINGTYGGASVAAVLTVLPAPAGAIARFGVSGTSITETCAFVDNGNSLACTFDGSLSTAPGPIVAWEWSYSVATTITQTTSGPKLTNPSATCALVPPAPLPAGVEFLTLTVKLKVHDSLGNVSAEAVNDGVRLLPQGSCGF